MRVAARVRRPAAHAPADRAGLPELADQSKALAPLRKQAEAINTEFDKTKPGTPERADVSKKLQANRAEQEPHDKRVKEVGNTVQFYQEMGGLIGRIALAMLIIAGLGRIAILRIFQVPALIVLPLTYLMLFKSGGPTFLWAYGSAGS